MKMNLMGFCRLWYILCFGINVGLCFFDFYVINLNKIDEYNYFYILGYGVVLVWSLLFVMLEFLYIEY